MDVTEKEIDYSIRKPYSTLNKRTEKTKNVWFVCHGMGHLSRYFLRYFKDLNPEENYIVAAQAPSLYYLGENFKHVGATWLTKENTCKETENVMRYFDAIFEMENLDCDLNLIVLGFSQGVSVATRYVAKRQLNCEQLILHSGGIPKELISEDFAFSDAKVSLIYGTKDSYLNAERIAEETKKAKHLFLNVTIVPFDGGHEVNAEIIKSMGSI
ncbi:MAG: esterase [Flavobacteriaceae bacterium]|nr:esterase [Flavobacteriaceae bacterium]